MVTLAGTDGAGRPREVVLTRYLLVALRSLLAMAAACVAVYAVNMAGAALAELAQFPGGGGARLLWDLGWVFVSGVVATAVLVRLAPVAPRAHALMFFVAALAICIAGVAQLGGDWPVWFSAGILLSLPLQVWFGARCGRQKGNGTSG